MAHVINANIYWKASRHRTRKAEANNSRILRTFVQSIVKSMDPTVLCFCEGGAATNPLTDEDMECVTEVVAAAWTDAATKHAEPEVRFHYASGVPLLTAWDAKQCDYRGFWIMRNVYPHKAQHTAQLFLCSLGGAENCHGVDVIYVHALSGSWQAMSKETGRGLNAAEHEEHGPKSWQ